VAEPTSGEPAEGLPLAEAGIGQRRDISGPVAPDAEPWLQGPVCRALGARSVRVLARERLKQNVHRLQVEVDRAERSVIAKRSQPEVARRNWLVARRWLPAVDLAGLAPPILGLAADPDGQAAWHLYEELPGDSLSREGLSDSEARAALDAIARVHASFIGHPLLRECRLWGGDRGIAFYSGNVSDALNALAGRGPEAGYRDALVERMEALRAQEEQRRESLSRFGGPETLLHGDLWTTNAIVMRTRQGVDARFVDWDEAAVGPVVFDLSTFLLQFDRSRRPALLDHYRESLHRLAGWRLSDDAALNDALVTVAYARLASLLVWTLASAEQADETWLPGRLSDTVGWLDEVEPVLAVR
jgi:Ser/Thr protein kinase RdoA (MazF antagonist)